MLVNLYDKNGKHRVSCPVLTFAQDANESYAPGLLLLEIAGPDSARRAIWSNIVKGRTSNSREATDVMFSYGGIKKIVLVTPTKTNKYHQVKDKNRTLLVHDGLSRFRYEYLLGGDEDEPSPWFFPAFQLNLNLPTLDHWMSTIWREAIDEGNIVPVQNYGTVTLWKVLWYEPRWQKLLSRLVKDGTLKEME
jgi:hypothetical protein